jgi:hypothetical protein
MVIGMMFALDTLVDFLAVYRYILRGIDAYTHLITLDTEYSNRDFVSNHESLTDPTSQYQHKTVLKRLAYLSRGIPPTHGEID